MELALLSAHDWCFVEIYTLCTFVYSCYIPLLHREVNGGTSLSPVGPQIPGSTVFSYPWLSTSC